MVSICASCKGLQKHLHDSNTTQETETDVLQWVNTSLLELRKSSGNCRACALILNGVLLHHHQHADRKEDDVWITAESFQPKPDQPAQDHLSVEVRWKPPQHQDCQDVEHEHEQPCGYPDLKLEFFTDGGMHNCSIGSIYRCA
ncbi:hypothetical protein J1614_009681 [Plenodomus biglobosus]|nr:hypothetical protein J1614_009681 [Plenodomus biglobosus]